MANKMLRVSGRDYSGLAKALRTDSEGNLITNQNEINVLSSHIKHEYVGSHRVYGSNHNASASGVIPVPTTSFDNEIWVENKSDENIFIDKLYIHNSYSSDSVINDITINQKVVVDEFFKLTKEDAPVLGDSTIAISTRIISSNSTVGNISVFFVGVNQRNNEITGKNVNGGTHISASLLQDNEGNGVIRTVDAAPFAYDEGTDSKRVRLIDRKRKIINLVDGYLPDSSEIRYYPGGGTNFYSTLQNELCDVRDLKNINITIANRLDVSISVSIAIASGVGNDVAITKHEFLPNESINVDTKTVKRIAKDEYSFIGRTFGYLSLRMKPATTPTEGGIYVDVEGELR